MNKRIVLLLCLAGVCNIIFATTIVIYITPDFVIMAADSRSVYTNAKTYTQTTGSVSKIYKSGNTYFSLAGLTSNDSRSFNVADIVNNKLVHATDGSSGINEIKRSIKAALSVYLNNQKTNNLALYKANLRAEKYITSVGIVGIKDSRPYSYLIGFVALDNGALHITTEDEVFDVNAGRDAVYYLGTSDAINAYMNTVQHVNGEPVKFVEKLMNLQIAKTPRLVAAPVDILKITPRQVIWIKRKKGTPVSFN